MKSPVRKNDRRHYSEAERRKIVLDYRSGSMSQVRLAAARGISVTTLQNWLRKYPLSQKDSPSKKLLPVRVLTDSVLTGERSSRPLFEILLNSHRKLRFPSGFDEGEVKKLVRLLEEPC